MFYLTKAISVESANDFEVASAIAHLSGFPIERRIERKEPYKGHSGVDTTIFVYHPEGEATVFGVQNGIGDLMVSHVDSMFHITYGDKVDPSVLDPAIIKGVIDARFQKPISAGLESKVIDKREFDD